MKALISTATKKTERVFLIALELKSGSSRDTSDSIAELAQLASTAGGEVVGSGIQRLETPVAGTFIGSGKAAEFARYCQSNEVDTVIFDDELSPAQSRNLEGLFGCKILDRTALILDIFAQRAQTREGKLQVELAQLQHLLPRLTRFWGHLSRQKGGIGMRGDGETQLETDRRRVQDRIHRITEDLETVRRQRSTQRDGRQRHQWPLASIVGYTNAGKSTLLNALTGAAVLVEDKLFATLDPTTRRLRLSTNQNVLLSDTVGFIRKLPHSLVESFNATLEEVKEADLLLHVVDGSHPQLEQQIDSVNAVLAELGAVEKPTLMVFNKIDQLPAGCSFELLCRRFPHAVAISAVTGEGIIPLLEHLSVLLKPVRECVELQVPHEQSAVVARLHQVGQVLERNYEGNMIWIKVWIPPSHRSEFAKFIVPQVEGRMVQGIRES